MLCDDVDGLAAIFDALLKFIFQFRMLFEEVFEQVKCARIGGIDLSGADIAFGGLAKIALACQRMLRPPQARSPSRVALMMCRAPSRSPRARAARACAMRRLRTRCRSSPAARSVTVFDSTETADFAFHRDASGMSQLHNFARDLNVVFKTRRSLSVCLERAVHHDAGKAHFNGGFAGLRTVAVILMEHDGNFRVKFARGQH